VAATLALIAAFMFALAATLQQRGALELGGVGSASSLLKLLGRPMWLLGTLVLFGGYIFQAAALDRGRLSIIQPLLVTTVVFALPLGYFLTSQIVGRREIVGAGVILVGLALFTYFADPSGGADNAPGNEWFVAIVVIVVVCGALLSFGGRSDSSAGTRAAVYGTVAGILFGLSASLTKPTVEYLHEGISELLSHWEGYALAVAGILGFVLQQVSLGTGKLAPSVATVSVANPIVGIAIGTLLLDERWSRPGWHILLGVVGLVLALAGAVVISVASERRKARPATAPAPA
jgi:drug/metabolite transporter (DMT)-like permease